jgi:hypothetical protein
MEGATKIVLRDSAFGPYGQDLAFLRLPGKSVGWLGTQRLAARQLPNFLDKSPPFPAGFLISSIAGQLWSVTRANS